MATNSGVDHNAATLTGPVFAVPTDAEPFRRAEESQPGLAQGRRWRPQTTLAVLSVFCAVGCLVYWLEHGSLRSLRHTSATQTAALARIRADARAILALRSAPQRAADRRKPNEELLAQVEQALKQANVPRQLWQDSVPQPPQRTADSLYERLSTRLYFEGITLGQLTAFAHRLLAADPTLSLSVIRINAGRFDREEPAVGHAPAWNAELAVSYLIYAPGTQQATAEAVDGRRTG